MKPAFEIKDLVCSYDGTSKNAVLEIPNLVLPKGEVVFLLGASGSGKSTLLEALGLMNDTIVAGDVKLHLNEDTVLNYDSIWEESNSARISEIRKSALSFIFQNTNLMDNFSVYENICLSSMIQKGVHQAEALDKAKELMKNIGLPESEVPTSTLAKNLSGGQRQRVAFARALNPGPKVLFGDEPTGNLDEKNADELLKIIKSNLGKESTAVIVSHDIRLALKHADRIVCFSKQAEGKPSVIRSEDIYERSKWSHLNELEKGQFIEKIRGYYHTNLEAKLSESASKDEEEDLASNYQSLFLSKEGKALLGPAYSNLLRLVGILTITLLAIGFANGSLHYLDVKLNDPFVNWLSVNIPSSRVSEIPELTSGVNNSDVKDIFHVRNVLSYTESPLFFFDKEKKTKQFVNGRSIGVRNGVADPLLKDILSEDNIVRGNPQEGFKSDEDLSLVVTERFMSNFGYALDDKQVFLDLEVIDNRTDERSSLIVPLPVRAVVKEMPGIADVAYSEFLYKAHELKIGSPLDIRKKNDLNLLIYADSTVANEVLNALKGFLRTDRFYRKYEGEATNYVKNYDSYDIQYLINIDFFPAPEKQSTLDSLWNRLINADELKDYKELVSRTYSYHSYEGRIGNSISYDKLSINFRDLEKVRDFSAHVRSTFNNDYDIVNGTIIEADLAKVREKENFNFLSTIAYIISTLVVLFGITSVSLFVSNLLRNHLSRIQMNLGTFSAFGLSEKKTQTIYFIIILRFIIVSLLTSVLLSLGAGKFTEMLMKQLFSIEEGLHYFKLWDTFTLYSIGSVIFIGVLVSWFTIRKMLNKTPGDLIYNR